MYKHINREQQKRNWSRKENLLLIDEVLEDHKHMVTSCKGLKITGQSNKHVVIHKHLQILRVSVGSDKNIINESLLEEEQVQLKRPDEYFLRVLGLY